MRFETLLLLLLAVPAGAQISPGELHRAHAGLEGNEQCGLCHSPNRGVDPTLCLDCHKLLSERIGAGAGLHARKGYGDCRTCHIEHHGRDFELVYWEAGMERFDHGESGYRLEGRHAKLGCRECHRAEHVVEKERLERAKKDLGRTFLGLGTACLSCHEDTHRGQLDAGCVSCHSQDAWRPASHFDHGATSYPLTGRHRKVACEKCHPHDGTAVRYKDLAHSSCASCHQDPHSGRLGSRCESCHTTADWRGSIDKASFDHNRTRYPLRGRHRQVACDDCHDGRPTRPIPGFERCGTCHEDAHLGQLVHRRDGGACDACHGVEGFRPARYGIEEHARSRYPLEGSHLAVACPACHQAMTAAELARLEPSVAVWAHAERNTPRLLFTRTGCADCHADPHGGRLEGGCASCHDLSSWHSVTYDHKLSGFPLEGAHQRVSCEKCHPRDEGGRMQLSDLPTYRPLGGNEGGNRCTGCHRDPHGGQLDREGRPQCVTCHTVWDWQPTFFDHDRHSTYRLDGAHRRVACAGCHPTEGTGESRRVLYRPLPTACVDCHGTGGR